MVCWGGAAAVEVGRFCAGGALAGAVGLEGARMPPERLLRGILDRESLVSSVVGEKGIRGCVWR